MDDPFWNVYYPPNHFKCRSTVRQRSGTYTTPDHKIEQAEIPPMFRTNLAKNGLVFPNEHPYYNHVPENALLSFGDANYKLDTVRELGDGKGAVYESGLAYVHTKSIKERQRKEIEYAMRLDVADLLANHFNTDVFITPSFEQTDWRFPYFFNFDKTKKRNPQPDFLIDKKYWELKSYEKNFKLSKIKTMLDASAMQSDYVVLKLNML